MSEVSNGKVIYEGGSGELEEKKSRFIANIAPVTTEEEAVAYINTMKKKYWDARHNCSAFIIGRNQELTRCSDDGEPSGTAGRPMLDVLLREGIRDVVVVVTRYFGGTLLGTGGLVRAYQGAVQEGLKNCTIIEKRPGKRLKISTDYTGLGKIQYLLAEQGVTIMDTEYAEGVELDAAVPLEQCLELEKKLTDSTSGKAKLMWEEAIEFADLNGTIKVF